jgi:predicted site-specific integrase-resolvase
MRTHSTEAAAKLIGISQITLYRWLAKALIRPSIAIPMRGKTLWKWTDADVKRAKLLKGTFRSGPKPKAK